MSALLSPRVWLALALAAALAFSHAFVYRAGRAAVRTAWDAEKLRQTQELADFNAESRRIEQKHQSTVMEAVNHAKTRETVLRSDAAASGAELGGLRNDLAAARAKLPSASCDAVRKRAAALDTVFDQCAGAFESLAGTASRHASDSLMFQEAWPK